MSNCPVDTDSDGIYDNIDVDIDNDGIYNTVESRLVSSLNLSDINDPTLVFQIYQQQFHSFIYIYKK
ncbi:MAG: hypothetical protein CM15mP122_1760 [Bacteroidota bacterium]|nr:MAG: hypothetical protein CM15mP122_1760 [Bacteroidota bacterium]